MSEKLCTNTRQITTNGTQIKTSGSYECWAFVALFYFPVSFLGFSLLFSVTLLAGWLRPMVWRLLSVPWSSSRWRTRSLLRSMFARWDGIYVMHFGWAVVGRWLWRGVCILACVPGCLRWHILQPLSSVVPLLMLFALILFAVCFFMSFARKSERYRGYVGCRWLFRRSESGARVAAFARQCCWVHCNRRSARCRQLIRVLHWVPTHLWSILTGFFLFCRLHYWPVLLVHEKSRTPISNHSATGKGSCSSLF